MTLEQMQALLNVIMGPEFTHAQASDEVIKQCQEILSSKGDFKAFVTLVNAHPSIKAMFQSRVYIDLACFLLNDITLTGLSLAQRSIFSTGAIALASILKKNSSLLDLDLAGNAIGDAGIAALVAALEQNKRLHKIDVSRNPIGDRGAVALARLLTSCPRLLRLDVWCNRIGSEGAKAFAVAIRANNMLLAIDLGRNMIADEGAIALAGALRMNDRVSEIDLSYCNISDRGALALAAMLRENRTLIRFYVSGNQMGAEGCRAIADALKHNPTITDTDTDTDTDMNFYIDPNGLNRNVATDLANEIEGYMTRNKKWLDEIIKVRDKWFVLTLRPGEHQEMIQDMRAVCTAAEADGYPMDACIPITTHLRILSSMPKPILAAIITARYENQGPDSDPYEIRATFNPLRFSQALNGEAQRANASRICLFTRRVR